MNYDNRLKNSSWFEITVSTSGQKFILTYLNQPNEPDEDQLNWIMQDHYFQIGPNGGSIDFKKVDSPTEKWLDEQIKLYEIKASAATEELGFLRAFKDKQSNVRRNS